MQNVLSHRDVSSSLQPHEVWAQQAPLALGILQARILEWVAMPFSRGSSQPKDETQISGMPGSFFNSELPVKTLNTEVGSLALLQGIFLTQE